MLRASGADNGPTLNGRPGTATLSVPEDRSAGPVHSSGWLCRRLRILAKVEDEIQVRHHVDTGRFLLAKERPTLDLRFPIRLRHALPELCDHLVGGSIDPFLPSFTELAGRRIDRNPIQLTRSVRQSKLHLAAACLQGVIGASSIAASTSHGRHPYSRPLNEAFSMMPDESRFFSQGCRPASTSAIIFWKLACTRARVFGLGISRSN